MHWDPVLFDAFVIDCHVLKSCMAGLWHCFRKNWFKS